MGSIATKSTLQALYDSEINFELRTFWDGGFDWKLGDHMNGYRAVGCAPSFTQAVIDMKEAAIEHFPNSAFAQERGK